MFTISKVPLRAIMFYEPNAKRGIYLLETHSVQLIVKTVTWLGTGMFHFSGPWKLSITHCLENSSQEVDT